MEAKINGKKIRELRNSSGLLIAHLSEEVDISSRMLSRMESDESYNPGVLTLLKVAEFFNVLIDDLLIKE